jgi:predicted permease
VSTPRRLFRLAIRRPGLTEADVDAEIRFHIELRIEQLVRDGWLRSDAEDEAHRRFGPSWDDAMRELHRSGLAREERLAMREHLDSLWRDLRYAVRGLRRAPRFFVAAVVTLALGLGVTTSIFSLVDHVVLRPLPYSDPARLVVVREIVGELRQVYPTVPANAGHFLGWRQACSACEGLAAVRRASGILTGRGDPRPLGVVRASSNVFSILGIRPQIGRAFRDEEDRSGYGQVVMLSDGFWRREFGADASVLGRSITLDGAPYEVIGVLPPGFGLPGDDALGVLARLPSEVDVYRPLALDAFEVRSAGTFEYVVLARLRPGATVEQVRAQLDAVDAGFAKRDGGATTFGTTVMPLQTQVVGDVRRPLLFLLAAVGAVLLIVCVNLTNLTLGRHAVREREAAVRVALGASGGRLARLALAESLVVALAGGMLGLMLARWGLRLLVAVAPATLPRAGEVELDSRVFGATALLTVLVGVLVGALPALRAARADPGKTLKAGGRSATGARAATRRRAVFIAAQIACSTVLLVGAGLFLSSFVRVMRVERGFDTAQVIALDVALPQAAYSSPAGREQFYARALAEVRAVPGVVTAAAVTALPLEGETWVNSMTREHDPRPAEKWPTTNVRFVSPGYFAAVGTAIRRGRPIAEDDRGRRVGVISERAARTLWPNEDAIGKRLRVGTEGGAIEVVGIATDVHTSTLEQEGSLIAYLPLWEFPPWRGTVVARTAGDAAASGAALRSALRRVDVAVPVLKVRTMAQVVSSAVAARRFQLVLLMLFAVMALVTASVGIYGVISQSLAARTGELGIRMALGARPADVHHLVLREGLTPVGVGLVAGVAASFAVGRAIESLLFGVTSGDPLTIVIVAVILGGVAIAACVIPTRRATRVGTAAMLRLE